MQKAKNFKIQFISLSSLVLTVLLTILQIYLIVNRFRLLKDLSTTFSQTNSLPILSNQQKLNNSLIINIFLLTFSLLFTIFYFLCASLKLGIYSHDDFKLGNNFDESKIKSEDLLQIKGSGSMASPCSTSMASEDSSRAVSMSKQILTKSSTSSKSIAKSLKCFIFSKPSFWSELPPPGACFHLLSALFLLLAEVQLTSKQIKLGSKPIGDIFSSKLDFLFGEPINRLKTFSSSQETLTRSLSTTTNEPKYESNLNDIINSKDDFSVFGTGQGFWFSSLVFTMGSNTINLEYLNFIIALLVFMLKVTQTFWTTSKKFTFLFFIYNFLVLILMSFSYCSFEILFKSNNLKAISKKFLFFGLKSTEQKVDFSAHMDKINLIDDYGHDLISTLLYTSSCFILFLNGYLISKFGYFKYHQQRAKFELNILNYLSNGFASKTKITVSESVVNESKDKIDLNENSLNKSDYSSNSSTSSTTKSQSEGSSTSTMDSFDENSDSSECKKPSDSNDKKFPKQSYWSFLSSYKENIISSILFLFYCVLRSLIIYELFIVYKYTRDYLFILNILFELVVFLAWIVILALLTIVDNWSFKVNADYKLVFWNWINHAKNLTLKNSNKFVSNSEARILLNSSLNSQKNILTDKTNIQKKNSDTSQKIQNENTHNTGCTKSGPGLLVRDDSVLNRSSYLSSSSITEVSSLMASTFATNLPKLPNQSSLNTTKLNTLSKSLLKQSPTILSVSNLKSSLKSPKSTENISGVDRNLVIVTDDDEELEKNFQKIQLARLSQNSNHQTYFKSKASTYNPEIPIERIQQHNQLQNFIIDGDDDEKDFGQSMNKKSSLNSRLSNNRNSTFSKPTIGNSNSAIATIGEVMEDPMNTSQINQTNNTNSFSKNCPISVIHKSINIIDSASSSSATVDSGRDSILESPVNNNANSALTPKQIYQDSSNPMAYNQNSLNSLLNNTHMSYNQSNESNSFNSQTVKLMQSSNSPLDTNC